MTTACPLTATATPTVSGAMTAAPFVGEIRGKGLSSKSSRCQTRATDIGIADG